MGDVFYHISLTETSKTYLANSMLMNYSKGVPHMNSENFRKKTPGKYETSS